MFKFKQFSIIQDASAMKVGTDGVLIGAWAGCYKTDKKKFLKILDVGTGTGLIALMLAQRFNNARIFGIDIDEIAIEEALRNVQNSPWSNRINVEKVALQEMKEEEFDMIVSNPPFFVDSKKNPDTRLAIARHTDTLPIDELLLHSSRLLSKEKDASISLILPPETARQALRFAALRGLFCWRFVGVKTRSSKPVKRVLLEFGKTPLNNIEECEVIMQHDDGRKTDWYRLLTADFYLDVFQD